jgi:hypothetical protein
MNVGEKGHIVMGGDRQEPQRKTDPTLQLQYRHLTNNLWAAR